MPKEGYVCVTSSKIYTQNCVTFAQNLVLRFHSCNLHESFTFCYKCNVPLHAM